MAAYTLSKTVSVVKPVGRPDFKNRIAASFGLKVAGYAQNAVIQQKFAIGNMIPVTLQFLINLKYENKTSLEILKGRKKE